MTLIWARPSWSIKRITAGCFPKVTVVSWACYGFPLVSEGVLRRCCMKVIIRTPSQDLPARHACGTHMHDRGASLQAVAQMLGRANLSTAQIYMRVSISGSWTFTARRTRMRARHEGRPDLVFVFDRSGQSQVRKFNVVPQFVRVLHFFLVIGQRYEARSFVASFRPAW